MFSSIVHSVVFILLWPIAPIYLVISRDIDSLLMQILVGGGMFIVALIGSSIVSLALSRDDRDRLKKRWEEEGKK